MKPTLSRLPIPLAVTVLLAALSLPARAIAAPVNLAQSDQIVTPVSADARRLAAYFSPPYHAGPLPPAVEEILLHNAPAELRAGCAAMVDSWGAAARGTSRLSIRILAVASGSAWLAWRCDSRIVRFENHYSEQLAVFTTARGTIQFLDLKAHEDTGATLYHVSFAETLELRDAESSAAFEVFAVGSSVRGGASNNAGGPLAEDSSASEAPTASARKAENRFVVIGNSAAAAKVVLALVTARERPNAPKGETGGAGAFDSDDEYRVALRFDHDLTGHVTAISAFYRDQSIGPRPRFGIIRYVWNPAMFTFAVAAPVRLRPVGPRPVPHQHLAY